jgi:hypothetical protein
VYSVGEDDVRMILANWVRDTGDPFLASHIRSLTLRLCTQIVVHEKPGNEPGTEVDIKVH